MATEKEKRCPSTKCVSRDVSINAGQRGSTGSRSARPNMREAVMKCKVAPLLFYHCRAKAAPEAIPF